MVNTRSIAVALIALVAAQASARERTAEETLDYFLTNNRSKVSSDRASK